MLERLALLPEPRSALLARRWVRDRLTGLGHDDLVDAATLGVSELVTNALLHARTSIVVWIRNDTDRLRIGVFDEAPLSRAATASTPAEGVADSTVGRGLHIVEAHAVAWGVAPEDDGKVVWFEPARAVDDESSVSTSLDDLALLEDVTLDQLDPAANDMVRVQLAGVPVMPFLTFQNHLLELIREMQLVALDETSALSDWAEHIAGLGADLEAQRHLTHDSVRALDAATAAGEETIDLVYDVPRRLGPSSAHMVDLLRSTDREAVGEQLLVTAPSHDAAALRDWFFTEIARQVRGEPPLSWPDSSGQA